MLEEGQTWVSQRVEVLWEAERVVIKRIEISHVLIEQIDRPAHPEYGHPRVWVSTGMFVELDGILYRRAEGGRG